MYRIATGFLFLTLIAGSGLADDSASGQTVAELLNCLEEDDRAEEGSRADACLEELRRRIRSRNLSDNDIGALLSRSYSGTAIAPPVSTAWKLTYHRLLEAYWRTYPFDDRERAAFDVEVEVMIFAKSFSNDGFEAWPANLELPMRIFVWKAWRPSQGDVIRARIDRPGAVDSEAVGGTLDVMLPPLEPGRHELSLRVEIGRYKDGEDFQAIQAVDLTLDVHAVEPSQRLKPVDLPDLSDVLLNCLTVTLDYLYCDDTSAERPLWHVMLGGNERAARRKLAESGAVLGASVEVRDAHGRNRWRGYITMSHETTDRWVRQWFHLQLGENVDGWTAVIRPLPALALYVCSDEDRPEVRYWSGEIIVPAREFSAEP